MNNYKSYPRKNVKQNKKNMSNKPRNNKVYSGAGYSRRARYNSLEKVVRTRKNETIEDIQSDIERLEKDIQFEIKQIRSARLGL